MKKTSLFEKKFKKKLEEDENTVGGGALGTAAATGHSQSGDWYASGDARVPKALGGIQTRRGTLTTKRRKKKKKK
jgi:hypothetical protein